MKNKGRVVFNLELYPLEVIQIAVKEYSVFCSVTLKYKKNKIVCTFSSNTIPADLIELEFGNYLIELMQQGVKA